MAQMDPEAEVVSLMIAAVIGCTNFVLRRTRRSATTIDRTSRHDVSQVAGQWGPGTRQRIDRQDHSNADGLTKRDCFDRERMTKEDLAELAHAAYWDARYSKDDQEAKAYDWLRSFDNVKMFLVTHLPEASSDPLILHLGSGNSTLPADLLALNYGRQTAVDFSEVVIANMRSENPAIDWRTMDIRAMDFPADSFDVCIDKATLDAMLYGSLWDPEPEVKANVEVYIDEVLRVLKPGGTFLYITWRQPHFIRPLLQRGGAWSMEVESLSDGGGMLEYFAFVLRKAKPV